MASIAKPTKRWDLVVVGGGVNGMVCALLAARRGLEVLLIEAHEQLGGGVRTLELTLPGFRHDVCSSVHPFGRGSPVLRSLDLESEGLVWVDPEVPLAHPLPGEPAVLLYRSVDSTAEQFGNRAPIYRTLLNSMVRDWGRLEEQLLGPPLSLPSLSSLLPLARFGLPALAPANALGRLLGRRGGSLWAGLAAHSFLPLESPGSSAVACVLGLLAHKVGWPVPRGGAAEIARALEQKLRRQGVAVETGMLVRDYSQLPSHRAAMLDLSAKQVLSVMGSRLSSDVARALFRYRLGPGVFKVDYALSEPVPWADPTVSRAGTVHLGGELSSIASSERAVWRNEVSNEPFLLGVQASLFDPTRAPDGRHTFWVYLHTPNGWEGDLLERLEDRLEQFAPGFREVVLRRFTRNNPEYESYNPNYVGGDIMGGANTLWQIVARPQLRFDPYHLGGSVFCCSASVPPGGGVHGMGGFHAFRSAWKRVFEAES